MEGQRKEDGERKGSAVGMDEEKGHREIWGDDLIEKVPSSNFSFIPRISSMY